MENKKYLVGLFDGHYDPDEQDIVFKIVSFNENLSDYEKKEYFFKEYKQLFIDHFIKHGDNDVLESLKEMSYDEYCDEFHSLGLKILSSIVPLQDIKEL